MVQQLTWNRLSRVRAYDSSPGDTGDPKLVLQLRKSAPSPQQVFVLGL